MRRTAAWAVLALLGATSVSAFELQSGAFAPGATIPAVHTCEGADQSPPLSWTEPPKNTKAFALVCEDPDAPAGTWSHWVVWDLPASLRALPEGIPRAETVPDGGKQGQNDFRREGWNGPCPPRGFVHRYVFRLYALDAPLDLPPRTTRTALIGALTGHTLARAELIGKYQRQ